jgi:hypothetical protein
MMRNSRHIKLPVHATSALLFFGGIVLSNALEGNHRNVEAKAA